MPRQLQSSDRKDPGSTQYSQTIGLVYLFNLIVGTGALAMPSAFGDAGWLLSSIVVTLLAFFSYVTATFVVESMACANALKRLAVSKQDSEIEPNVQLIDPAEIGNVRNQLQSQVATTEDNRVSAVQESSPLISPDDADEPVDDVRFSHSGIYEITETVEMGEMASLFFNQVGIVLFYLCIIVYLYGDLAIYAVAVPKSVRDVACSFNVTGEMCWASSSLTRTDVYRIFVAAFFVLIGPFVFFNLRKTMPLQVLTTILRWTSFLMMVILTIIHLAKVGAKGHPPVAEPLNLANVFGVCVYAFMCHHSLPQLTTPIRDKSSIFRLIAADYFLILSFYLLLCFTAIYTFSSIEDLYTLNFSPSVPEDKAVTDVAFVEYFLALFPVFTLSSSFPIIGITLRNNLKTLVRLCWVRYRDVEFPWQVDRLCFPIVTLVLPLIIALSTENIQMLVGITGSYAGAVIQYVLPASFVLLARQQIDASRRRSTGRTADNPHQSPFRHTAWCIVIFSWSVICVVLVTVNNTVSLIHRWRPIHGHNSTA